MFVHLQHSKIFKHNSLSKRITLWSHSKVHHPSNLHYLDRVNIVVAFLRLSWGCRWISGSSLCFCVYLRSAACWFYTQVLNLFIFLLSPKEKIIVRLSFLERTDPFHFIDMAVIWVYDQLVLCLHNPHGIKHDIFLAT